MCAGSWFWGRIWAAWSWNVDCGLCFFWDLGWNVDCEFFCGLAWNMDCGLCFFLESWLECGLWIVVFLESWHHTSGKTPEKKQQSTIHIPAETPEKNTIHNPHFRQDNRKNPQSTIHIPAKIPEKTTIHIQYSRQDLRKNNKPSNAF